jgi:hypothetical protein
MSQCDGPDLGNGLGRVLQTEIRWHSFDTFVDEPPTYASAG